MGLNELQVRKMDRAFGHMDVNGNGFAERDDLQAVGARLILAFGEFPTSAKGRAVLDTFDGIWDELREAMDPNGDGKLSPEEFRSGMDNSFIHGAKYDLVFHPAAQAVMDLCDTTGDGTLSMEEFLEFQKALGTDSQHSQAAFAALDRDRSNRLDVSELLITFREYYTSADVNAGGNMLYGPL